MQLTESCFGMWSGGRFMRFGVDIGRERMAALIRRAYQAGVRTFVTADVYGEGEADRALGEALAAFERSSYCLVGAVGHDFYKGEREEGVFPRFTDPALRGPQEYAAYLRMAAQKSLERLKTGRFDLLMLHNPDSIGYTHEKVWQALAGLKKEGLTERLGLAPGPANGFTLDVLAAFEAYGELIDWAMLILNPLEPWPGHLALPAAQKHHVQVLTRVVEYGGMFLDGVRPGAKLNRQDHRSFRPAGWIEAAHPKVERCRELARANGLTLLQLASRWNLAQPAVASVVPTLIQEAGAEARPIEGLVDELAQVGACAPLPPAAVEEIARLGDNRNCMALKGASSQHLGRPLGDQWPLTPALRETARRWNLEPDRDLYYANDPRDIRELGAAVQGVPQASTRRLYAQLLAFGGCRDTESLVKPLRASGLEFVLYRDLNDPLGVGLLVLAEDPEVLAGRARELLAREPFATLSAKPELTMLGRSYSSGREPDLEDWLLVKPRRNALNPENRWAVWYPLRRKPDFALLSKEEQGRILFEHAMLGRTFGQSGYAQDIRLSCYGLDRHDNEFVLGLVGPELYPLSRLIQEMRKTQQTAKYMQSLGPFFVGRVHAQSPL